MCCERQRTRNEAKLSRTMPRAATALAIV